MRLFDVLADDLTDGQQRSLVHLMKQCVELGQKAAYNEGYEAAMHDLGANDSE